MIPTFRRGDFDTGVVATVRALASAAREEAYAGPPRVRTDGRTGPARDRSGRSDVDFFLSTLPFFAAWFGGVGLLAFTGFKVRRYRPRRCPNGHGSMRRLSESEDDARLAKEESFEETLGSVDYDVWVCAQCDAKRVLPYRKLWSKYETCPNCQRRTCAKLETITMKATYEREGERILRRKCKLCGYNVRERQVIPVLTHSGSSSSDWSSGGGGSSSSSDFGGGSSGGGGAGRSY